jgi:hypothetical protein
VASYFHENSLRQNERFFLFSGPFLSEGAGGMTEGLPPKGVVFAGGAPGDAALPAGAAGVETGGAGAGSVDKPAGSVGGTCIADATVAATAPTVPCADGVACAGDAIVPATAPTVP